MQKCCNILWKTVSLREIFHQKNILKTNITRKDTILNFGFFCNNLHFVSGISKINFELLPDKSNKLNIKFNTLLVVSKKLLPSNLLLSKHDI